MAYCNHDKYDAAWYNTCQNLYEHRIPNEYFWKGIILPGGGGFCREYVETVADFEVNSDDVILATYPKSGTTWLQEVTWLIHNDLDFGTSKAKPAHERIPFLEEEEMGIPMLNKLDKTKRRLIKTHLPYCLLPKSAAANGAKIIYCYRNPKDVCTSYFHFYRSNPDFGHIDDSKWDTFYEMFLAGYVGWGSWFDHVTEYWLQYELDMASKAATENNEATKNSPAYSKHPQIKCISFETMKQQPEKAVRDLASFCGITLSDEQVKEVVNFTSFDRMKQEKNLYPPVCKDEISPFMRKGEIGDWRNHFTVTQSEFFDSEFRTKMEGVFIPLQFE